tara:strand:- start:33156 stop:33869 length:714 start_codon:yes stop_codon:yes gene_type:complete
MANVKEYGFYIEGRKLCIVERDTQFDNDVNSRDYGPGVHRTQWRSPKSTVDVGLELQYTHTPDYFLKSTSHYTDTNLTQFRSNSGFLEVADNTSSYTNYATLDTDYIAVGSYIVLGNADRWNGLHKIRNFSSATGTNNVIILETKYSGSATFQDFSGTPTLYYSVDILNDEDDELPIPSYLEKALVYYVKAKLAEDQGEFESKEYFMREYRKITEKYDSSLKSGARIMATPGPYAVR